MDVRMLGSGRPFAFEMQNPRRLAANVTAVEMAQLQETVNKTAAGRIAVNSLKVVPKSYCDQVRHFCVC